MSRPINEMLIPKVNKTPQKESVKSNKLAPGQTSEFGQILNKSVEAEAIQLSTHAAKRLQERNLSIDKAEFNKLGKAIGKLKEKGGRDSLIITNNGAYIVDVDKSRIVTAMDKESLKENVFTKIDSTIYMN